MSEWFTIDEQVWQEEAVPLMPIFMFFDGYLDAGRVGATVIETLLEHCRPKLLGTFDWDLVHDYRARRPGMLFDTDHWVSVEQPVARLHIANDAADEPFLVLRAPEPDQRWKLLVKEFEKLFCKLDVGMIVSAHGFPMTLPHTRPTPLTVYSNSQDLRVPNPRWVDRLTIPASFISYLDFHLGPIGIRTLGVGAHVPHYLAGSSFGQAAATVMHHLADATKLRLPTDELDLEAQANLMAIEADTANDETAAELLAQLEEQYDRYSEATSELLPTADELGAAVEKFLAQQNDDPPQG
ncbi:MAG: PAC2 family protein [Arachnia propionica]|uniref:PAC2 family protein n=1 Tax=Arachnia propionica TaxID=1750 RepID=UPI0026F9FF16|nr:PAC2 family protein [Arachnia propionica]